jgi:hypothetical protein
VSAEPGAGHIYSNEIVCIDHSQYVKIESLDHDLVKMTIKVHRKIKNISNNNHQIVPEVWVDEWLVVGTPSAVGDCGYRVEGGEERRISKAAPDNKSPVPKLFARAADHDEVTLQPRAEMEIWASYTETKRKSDSSYSTFTFATQRPRVHLAVPDGFGSHVKFSHRLDGEALHTGDVVLPGLLLPHQGIIFRWWVEDEKKAWINTATRTQTPTPEAKS